MAKLSQSPKQSNPTGCIFLLDQQCCSILIPQQAEWQQAEVFVSQDLCVLTSK